MFKTIYQLLIITLVISQACSSGKRDDKVPLADAAQEELIPMPASKIRAIGQEKGPMAIIEFVKTSHDFGRVYHGEKLEYTFTFVNKGETDLVIYSANASCGCTVPEFDKQPIPPGQQGKIKIVFNTRGFRGLQNKSISVSSNASNNYVILTVSANIIV